MTDTMPAGRELDALVAEKLDLPRVMTISYYYPGAPQYPPCYSTDWDAMRQVVERMLALGYCVEMGFVGPRPYCLFLAPSDAQPPWCTNEHGDTLPHAVALAALKAVEAQR